MSPLNQSTRDFDAPLADVSSIVESKILQLITTNAHKSLKPDFWDPQTSQFQNLYLQV
jgi:hypothetical protein